MATSYDVNTLMGKANANPNWNAEQKAKVSQRAQQAFNPSHDTNSVALEQSTPFEVAKLFTVQPPAPVADNSSNLVQFLKEREGFTPTSMYDYGNNSIGYGIRTENPNETIDEAEATRRLNVRANEDRTQVANKLEALGHNANANQIDALSSFAFNAGQGNLDTLLEGRTLDEIGEAMALYNQAGGAVNEGVANRRQKEQELFNTTPASLSDTKAALVDTVATLNKTDVAVATVKKRQAMGGEYGATRPASQPVANVGSTYVPTAGDTSAAANPSVGKAVTDASKFIGNLVPTDSELGALAQPALDFIGENFSDQALRETSGGLAQAVDVTLAVADKGTQALGSVVAGGARQLNELGKDSEAVVALRESQDLEQQIIDLNEQKTGSALNDAGISQQIATLQERKGELDTLLDAETDAGTIGATKREAAQGYLGRKEFVDNITENSKVLAKYRNTEDYDKLTGDVANQVAEHATEFTQEGVTPLGLTKAASDYVRIALDNPRGATEFLAEQIPNLFLGVAGNITNVTDQAFLEAESSFKAEYGREPTDQETAMMQGLSLLAGGIGAFGDEATKGALKPILNQASKLIPNNVLGKVMTGILGTPVRITATGVLEGISEGSENVVTQLAGKQTGDRTLANVDLQAVATEAILGAGAGGATNVSVEVGSNPIVRGTASLATDVAVGAIKKAPKATLKTAELATKAVAGTAKFVTKTLPKNVQDIKAKQAAKKTAESEATPDTVEEVESVVQEEQAAPVVTPVPAPEEIKNTTSDISDLASTVNEEDASTPEVKGLVAKVKEASEGLLGLQGVASDQPTLNLLGASAQITQTVTEIAAKAQELAATDLPESDRIIATEIANRITAQTSTTVAGALASLSASNPLVGTAIDALVESITSGDTDATANNFAELDSYIETLPEGQVETTRQSLVDSLLQTTLFSGKPLDMPVEQLRNAANIASSPEVKAQYEAIAAFKDTATVADEVLRGSKDGEFTGVKQHLQNLKAALQSGNKVQAAETTDRLKNFQKQRDNKVKALKDAIAEAESSGIRQEVPSTLEGQKPYLVHPTEAGLNAANALVAQVTKESDLVAYGLQAANTIQGIKSPEAINKGAEAYKKSRGIDQPTAEVEPEVAPEQEVPTEPEAEVTTEPTLTKEQEEDLAYAEAEPEVEQEVVTGITPEGEVITEVVNPLADPEPELTPEEAVVVADDTDTTLDSLVESFGEAKLEGETDSQYERRTGNRFKANTTKVANSPIWAKDNLLDVITRLDPAVTLGELKSVYEAMGFDTSKLKEADVEMVKGLRAKKVWFNGQMGTLAERVVAGDASDIRTDFKENNVLRQLLDAEGNFPPKVVAAAFMAYVNGVQSVGESFYTDDNTLQTMLGFTDDSQLNELQNISQFRTLGAAVTPDTMGKAFKRALGLKLAKDAPLSIQDRVNSAMGYSLQSVLQTDPEMHFREELEDPNVKKGKVLRGFTVRTAENDATFQELTGTAPKATTQSFFTHMGQAGNAITLATNPENSEPKNYIDEIPPEVTTKDTHIRSGDNLTAAQVKAENLYRKVAWVPDTLLSSFSSVLGLDGFKRLNGYVEQGELDQLNVNEKRSTEGTNLKLVDQFEKMTNMLGKLSPDSKIYFASAFSLVRRQQMRGEVNPQGDKWHRVVLGLENSPTVGSMNLNKLTGKGRKGDGYYFMLALGQALGLDADKQSNAITYQETVDIITQELASEGDSLANRLAGYMLKDGTFPAGTDLPVDLLDEFNSEAKGNFHKQQGILTLAKLLRQADANGNVTNFKHFLRFEVDGLTNGPFHSTFLTGLGSMSAGEAAEYMKKGGFMTSQNADNAHTQIGDKTKKFTDFYLTAAAIAQTRLDEFTEGLQATIRDPKTSKGVKFATEQRLKSIEFLAKKAEITNYDQSTGEITIKRKGTKNPVTVTVYGGGESGIHRSIASEIADIFYNDMSTYLQRINDAVDADARATIKAEIELDLESWSAVMYQRNGAKFQPLMNFKKARTVRDVKAVLVDTTLNTGEFNALSSSVADGIGGAITAGIDEVFAGNKHTAALMNASLNAITVLANDTFSRAYKALHAKRVAENVINKEDSLSREDTDLIQKTIQKALPFVKTSIQSSEVNIAKEGRDSVAGLQKVSAPSLTQGKQRLQQTDVDHSTTNFASPGVRGIPVLTISVDGNTMVLNHLLQTKNGKTLNVLDANDTVPDRDIRASNEVFNAAEFISLATSDPLARVQETVTQSLAFQSQPMVIDGIVVQPLLTSVDTGDASIGSEQEQLRNALNELTLPIHKKLPSLFDTGNLNTAFDYLLSQLEIERNNAQVARDNFMFGNASLLMNQMAGIDNGGAKIVGGQIKLTSQAETLIGEAGVAKINTFNQQMAGRKAVWEALPKTTELDTETEQTRKDALLGDDDAASAIREQFTVLSGLWQGLRAEGRFNSDTVSYDMGLKENQLAFKKLLFGKRDVLASDDPASQFETNGSIPNNGILFDGGANQTRIDAMLKNLNVEIVSNLPQGVDGSMQIIDGKYVIKMRKGLSTKAASRVLQHEVTHALVAHGLTKGVKDRTNKVKSLEAVFVAEQLNQIGRFLKSGIKDNAVAHAHLTKYINQYKANQSPQNLYTLLQEHMALVAADGLQAQFELTTVDSGKLSGAFKSYITGALASAAKYINKLTGGKFNLKQQPFVSEKDVFANLLSGYATSAGTLSNQSELYSGIPENEASILRQGENRVDDAIRSVSNKGIVGFMRLLGKAEPSWLNAAEKFELLSPEGRSKAWAELKNDFLTSNQDGEKMNFLREFIGEFMSRDREGSKVVDSINNVKTTKLDTVREDTKATVARKMDDAFGGLTDTESKAVTNGIVRTDLGALVNNGTPLATVRTYLNDPTALTSAITAQVAHLKTNLGLNNQQFNLMVNEARSLGKRQIVGGAFEGFNLPNAKAIADLAGLDVNGSTNPLVEVALDELSSLVALAELSTEDSQVLSRLIREQLNTGSTNNGITHVIRKHAAIKKRIVKQHGEGILMGLPKGYVPDVYEAGNAVRVVADSDLNKPEYQGWTKVRRFKHEGVDPEAGRSWLMRNTEGSTASFVQGAMSTIELSVGGFVTATGKATDKSLPSYGAGNRTRGIAQNKAKLVTQLGKKTFDLKPKQDGMIPNINALGMVIGYRYTLNNEEKTELMGLESDAGLLLGTHDARVVEEGFAVKYNQQLATALGDAYKNRATPESLNTKDRDTEFVKVHAGSSDPQLSNIWEIMPQHLKDALAKEFGGSHVWVHKRDLTNALGYREWSISELWKDTSKAAELATLGAELILGQDAPKKLRWAERRLQAGVTEVKDLIVVKSIVVPAQNIVSNLNQLHLRGIPFEDITKDSIEGAKYLKEYKDLRNEFNRVKNDLDTQDAASQQQLNFRYQELDAQMKASPIRSLIDAGLLPTVVDDLQTRQGDGIFSEITDRLPKKGDSTFIDTGREIAITNDSTTYQLLSESLEYGDFVAKYVLYKHLTTNGSSDQDAIDAATVEFINYNALSPRSLDYLNKVGAMYFFKYFSRIQPIIANAVLKNPTRALMTFAGADTIGLPSIFDALWVTKDLGYTTGLYDLFSMAGGAHPVFGNVL